MEITCYRDSEIGREARHLSASTYNLAITLLARCKAPHLFVPIRSMQYLAILNVDEFVFIDGERKCWIDIAWQHFQPQVRTSLGQPVGYDAVYYRENQAQITTRLHSEFPGALRALEKKEKLESPGRVIMFPASNKS